MKKKCKFSLDGMAALTGIQTFSKEEHHTWINYEQAMEENECFFHWVHALTLLYFSNISASKIKHWNKKYLIKNLSNTVYDTSKFFLCCLDFKAYFF